LRWEVPAGRWEILRLGCTLNDHCRVSTCSEGWDGYAIDPFDAGAFTRYWDAVVEPLIADAGPLAGTTLKYLHTDSWEVEVANWTPTLREEFRQRRGYDPLPWLPVITGRIIGSRDASNRFLHDLRRTMGDLAIDHHYRMFKERAHAHGLLIHPESGGPHAVPIDAQQCLMFDDAPMSEFWAWSWRHRIGDANRFFVKQPASAAHVGGHRYVLAEGFTTIGPHWQETLWDNLKPAFDHAGCEGLNRLVWHAFVCSPEEMGIPGQQYFAGTHVNPNATWWPRGKPFFDYLNRCQWMLQQGRFVADVACYYGDHVPNFAQYKATDPAGALPGQDYDVLSADAVIQRLRVENGRLVLPDGMSYRVLALPDREAISLPVLEKVNELVADGAVIVGRKPVRATSLQNPSADDHRVQQLARRLWGGEVAGGKVYAEQPAREVLADLGVSPDFTCAPADARSMGLTLDTIHRRLDETDIYFLANRTNRAARFDCSFRVAAKAPELWNAVTGERRFASAYESANGRTTLPLEFAPCGSWFVVFREPAEAHPPTAPENRHEADLIAELSGPWQVHFPRGMSADEFSEREMLSSATRTVVFDSLESWTSRPEPGIKFYSGAASYMRGFDLPEADAPAGNRRILLDLGEVRELADVRVNGRECGIVWTPPFRVDITEAVKPGANTLLVDVINFWPNRLIGDSALPVEQRRTQTNIRKFTPESELMRSGLFGPVRLLRTQDAEAR
ncbi:MAG: glycoside hydrolase, partial [Verrucomicrobiae bacterium]|nr:glycoside hydrolase [Verrucomicrobiae bacterium]